MVRAHRVFLLVLVVLATTGGACALPKKAAGDKLEVVTGFYPIEFVARRIGGSFVDVVNLTPPGGEPHDLELKPSDVVTLRTADLILYFGEGFQVAVDDALRSVAKTRVVDLLAGMDLKPPTPDQSNEGLSIDPHVWLSPSLMQTLTREVAVALENRLPSAAARVQAAAKSLDSDLAALDAEFRLKLTSCERREIFTSHAAFAYLADRYNLTQVPIAGLSPEAEPSSQRLQQIAQRARAAHATTIFFEALVSPRVSQTVARIVGARSAVLDPIEGLTTDGKRAGEDYFSIMRKDLAQLEEALACKE